MREANDEFARYIKAPYIFGSQLTYADIVAYYYINEQIKLIPQASPVSDLPHAVKLYYEKVKEAIKVPLILNLKLDKTTLDDIISI